MSADGSNGGGEWLDPAVCTNLAMGATFNLTNSRYLTVAGLTVALYDIFLLMADEVRRSSTQIMLANQFLDQISVEIQLEEVNTDALFFQSLCTANISHHCELSLVAIPSCTAFAYRTAEITPWRPALSTGVSILFHHLLSFV